MAVLVGTIARAKLSFDEGVACYGLISLHLLPYFVDERECWL